MSLVLNSSGGGSVTLQEPVTAVPVVQTLAAEDGTLAPIVSGTAVTASGTAVNFTGIPSWAKRITVMFSGVSTNGASNPLVQLGSGSPATSGYLGSFGGYQSTASGGTNNYTTGFGINSATAAAIFHGVMVFTLVSGNIWVASQSLGTSNSNIGFFGGGSVTLSGPLDRIRITTVNGTDTFDAGTINILYE